MNDYGSKLEEDDGQENWAGQNQPPYGDLQPNETEISSWLSDFLTPTEQTIPAFTGNDNWSLSNGSLTFPGDINPVGTSYQDHSSFHMASESFLDRLTVGTRNSNDADTQRLDVTESYRPSIPSSHIFHDRPLDNGRDETPLLICTYSDCTTKPTYTRSSDLKKHMDRHLKPYYCPHSSCLSKDVRFPSKGGMTRHEKIHQSETTNFTCPNRLCPRHQHGFRRKDNLNEHLKRNHNHGKPYSRGETPSNSNSENKVSYDIVETSGDMSTPMEVNTKTKSCENSQDWIAEKLAQLREQHSRLEAENSRIEERSARLVEDIAALERTLRLCES